MCCSTPVFRYALEMWPTYAYIIEIEGIDHITGRYYCSGEFTVRYKDRYSSFSVIGVHPDHAFIENQIGTNNGN